MSKNLNIDNNLFDTSQPVPPAALTLGYQNPERIEKKEDLEKAESSIVSYKNELKDAIDIVDEFNKYNLETQRIILEQLEQSYHANKNRDIEGKESFSVNEVAEILGKTPRTIKNYLKQKKLKGFLEELAPNKTKWKIPKEEVMRFL